MNGMRMLNCVCWACEPIAQFHQHYDRWTAELTPAERDALVVGLSALLRAGRHLSVETRPVS